MTIADKSAEMSWFNFVLFGRRRAKRDWNNTIDFSDFCTFLPFASSVQFWIGFYFNTHFTSLDAKSKWNKSIYIFINSSNRSTTHIYAIRSRWAAMRCVLVFNLNLWSFFVVSLRRSYINPKHCTEIFSFWFRLNWKTI